MFPPVLLRVAAAGAVLAGLAAGASAARADTTLTTCSSSDFAAAVAAGGTVTFGLDCPDLVVSQTVNVLAGKTLDLEGNGHNVALDGGHARRLFLVSGQLTVRGMTLENGSVTGANGANGKAGATGANGAPGGAGASPGGNGSPGGAGTGGANGTAGKAGVMAKGGAVLINAGGSATFDHVVFSGNAVRGGTGGVGGVGGNGGNGGDGGAGRRATRARTRRSPPRRVPTGRLEATARPAGSAARPATAPWAAQAAPRVAAPSTTRGR